MISFLLLIIIYLTFICFGLQDPLLGAAWPSIYIDLNVPLSHAGFLSMIMYVGRVFTSILSEKVIKRFTTGPVILTGALILAASLFGFSFSRSFLFLCIIAVPFSIGVGMVDVTLNNYVALHYKAKYMIWLHCFWSTGASIGPLIMSFFLINNTWNSGYRAIGIVECFLAVIIIATLSLWKKNNTIKNETDENIQITHQHTREKKANALFSITESIRLNLIRYKEILYLGGVKQIIISFFIYIALQITIVLWGSSFLVMEKNILPETAALWISVYYIGLTLGRFVSGFISIKLNNRQIIRLGHGIIALGLIAVILPFNGFFLMPGFFILGFGCAPVFPCLVHETPKIFGSDKSPAIIGLEMAFGNMGAILIPPLFGWIASAAGFYLFPFFVGALLIINILVFESLIKKTEK
ncbi:MAG: MFS transporter [Treponema sp.]|jgi:fucose permease|nr:MFS transporter [Treponema sp.]